LKLSKIKKRLIRIKNNFFTSDSKVKYLIQKLLLLSGINLPFKIRISDNSYILFQSSKESISYFLDKTFKLEERLFITNFLNIGETFIDVGANIGALSIIAKEKVGTQGKCFAFEANPKVYNEMVDNFKINKYVIEAVNCALSDKTGEMNFYMRKYADDFGSLSQNTHDGDLIVKVKSFRADKVISYENEVTLLKIDVEGAEYLVLKGFGDILNRVRFIKFENHLDLFKCFKIQFSDIFSLLNNFEFCIFHLKAEKLIKLTQNYDSSKRADLFALREKDKIEFTRRTGLEFA